MDITPIIISLAFLVIIITIFLVNRKLNKTIDIVKIIDNEKISIKQMIEKIQEKLGNHDKLIDEIKTKINEPDNEEPPLNLIAEQKQE